ncbi:MAG: hypothetical protein NZM11_11770, partial [Anaerolineales bacterium]|nr:hypothetical protein [Anaerolineales bacterium]
TVARPTAGERKNPALAEADTPLIAGLRPAEPGGNFGVAGHTGAVAPTPRTIARLAGRTPTPTGGTLPHCQKALLMPLAGAFFGLG